MPSLPLQSGGPEPAHLAICGSLLVILAIGLAVFALLRKRKPQTAGVEITIGEGETEATAMGRLPRIGSALLRGLAALLDLITKFIALGLVALFIAAALVTLILFNLGWQLFDPNPYKRALAEARIYERFPALIAEQMAYQLAYVEKHVGVDIENMSATPELEACLKQALGEESFSAIAGFEREPTDAELEVMRPCFAQYGEVESESQQGGPPEVFSRLTQTDLENLLSILIPATWLQTQTESAIDQTLAFLNSDAPTLSLDIDLVKLREHLRSGAAAGAFLYIVRLQPPCTGEQIAELTAAPLNAIPPCLPPNEILNSMVEQSEGVLNDVIAKIPDQTGLSGIGEQGPGEQPPGETGGPLGSNPLEAVRRIHMISRFSPLLPLALLLLIALFGARSLQGLLRWWGASLLIVGVVGVILALAALPTMDWAIAAYVMDRLPASLSPAFFAAVLEVLRNIARTVATWIGGEAGVIALIGLLMLAAQTRGGLGRREVFRVPDDEDAPQSPVNLGIQSGRFRIPPEGLFGGKPGAKAQFLVNGRSGNPYGLTRLRPGDTVIMDAAGGGYGDPKERDRAQLIRDVRDGKVTRESAKRDYGVEITDESP